MLLGLAYQLIRFIADLVLVRTRSDAQLSAEVLALRHQLRVLERRAGEPAWQPGDRLLLAALSRLLPRSGWSALLPRPETLLCWHRGNAPNGLSRRGQWSGPGVAGAIPALRHREITAWAASCCPPAIAAGTRSVRFTSTSPPMRRGINTIKLVGGSAITNTRLRFEQSDLRPLNPCRAAPDVQPPIVGPVPFQMSDQNVRRPWRRSTPQAPAR